MSIKITIAKENEGKEQALRPLQEYPPCDLKTPYRATPPLQNVTQEIRSLAHELWGGQFSDPTLKDQEDKVLLP